LSLFYLLHDSSQALENIKLAKNYLAGATGHSILAFFNFYDSLTQLAVYANANSSKQTEILQQVASNQGKMKLWAQHAPMNFQHKYDLVEAEKARVLGQHWEAVESYEKAIAGARENEYLQEEALAYELAARFYLSPGMEKVAQTYLQEASYRYQRWGATAKVQHLQTQYPQLLARSSNVMPPSFLHTRMTTTTVSSTTSHSTGTPELDVHSIIKASQILSEGTRLATGLEAVARLGHGLEALAGKDKPPPHQLHLKTIPAFHLLNQLSL
jgi:tetratricopeptide (TPR) repeat protein